MPEFPPASSTILPIVDLFADVDDHHYSHSSCTYIPVTILGAARHSLYIDPHCPDVNSKAPLISSLKNTNKQLHPPLYTAPNLRRLHQAYLTHPTYTCKRPLTHVAITPHDEMNEAPGSPPGLTGSKSSKSSSYRSSSISGADAILSDTTHFEGHWP